MPELPEVETVRRGLAPVLEGRRIARALAFASRPIDRPIDRRDERQQVVKVEAGLVDI
jgi:formamidopyrimidine-DNA glycosylase